MKIKRILSLVLLFIIFGSCSVRKEIEPINHPSIEITENLLQEKNSHIAFRIKEFRHSDIVLGLEVPQDTSEIKYIDDYFCVDKIYDFYESEKGVLYAFTKCYYYEPFEMIKAETAYRSRCYEDGEFVYSENDKGYIPELIDSYSDVKDSRSVFYFNNKLETPGELNNNAKPYFITPWCKEEQDEYMDVWKDNIYDTYDTESALPASFYPLDGVCAYQYGVAIFYEDDYCVRAIAYKDSDEARAVVDEFCDFYGVPTPAEYYEE